MRNFGHAIELGAIPVLGRNVPARGPALDLTRREFTIGKAARPFISPSPLIWRGLPGEETAISRSFFARSDAYEARNGEANGAGGGTDNFTGWPTAHRKWAWTQYVLYAMRDAKRWIPDGGAWGGREWDALAALIEILDEWIRIQEQVVQLTRRQIQSVPAGAYADKIRSPEHWGTFSVIPKDAGREAPGLANRWPLEVYTVAKAILNELRWARIAFGGDGVPYPLPAGGRRVAGGGILKIIAGHVDCTRSSPDGLCLEVAATTSNFQVQGDLYETYKKSMAYLSGAAGMLDNSGNPPDLAGTFPLFQDVVDFIVEISNIMTQYEAVQDAVIDTVKEVIDEISAAVSDAAQITAFAETIGEIGGMVPIIGAMIEMAADMAGALLRQAAIDAANRRERGLPEIYRGVDRIEADGTIRPLVLGRRDVETWALMMFRAMKLQEIRLAALVDGTSPLPGMVSAKAPGEAELPRRYRPRRAAAGLSAGAKTALAIGGGASAAGLVWWLVKRFSRRTR